MSRPSTAPHPPAEALPPLRVESFQADGGAGPEDVLPEGDAPSLTFGLDDGRIVRREAGRCRTVARTGGRPLGLERLPDGRLLVCDAWRGLLAVDDAGSVETLCDVVDDAPLGFCNNAAVEPDGTIYFSSSSARYGLDRVLSDIVGDTRTGRLIRRDPGGICETVMDGLAFANGVALVSGAQGRCVLVAATGGAAIHRLWLTGGKAGTRDVFAENLPLMPDNLAIGTDGLVWAGGPSRWSPALAAVHRLPAAMRRAVGALGDRAGAGAGSLVAAMAFEPGGWMVRRFEGRHPGFRTVTGAREHHGTVWLGSLEGGAVASFAVPPAP